MHKLLFKFFVWLKHQLLCEFFGANQGAMLCLRIIEYYYKYPSWHQYHNFKLTCRSFPVHSDFAFSKKMVKTKFLALETFRFLNLSSFHQVTQMLIHEQPIHSLEWVRHRSLRQRNINFILFLLLFPFLMLILQIFLKANQW